MLRLVEEAGFGVVLNALPWAASIKAMVAEMTFMVLLRTPSYFVDVFGFGRMRKCEHLSFGIKNRFATRTLPATSTTRHR